jgi:hypothetical protein
MLAILFCIGLFDIFSRKKEFECKTINIISSLIFGVYLISDNNYIRPILWRDIIKSINYIHKPYLILHLLISVFIIIIVCLIIEAIRKYLIEKTIFKKLDLFIDKLQIRIDNKIDKKLSNYIK